MRDFLTKLTHMCKSCLPLLQIRTLLNLVEDLNQLNEVLT